jgi:PhnB protein
MKSPESEKVPAGYHTVTPWIIARGAGELIDFLKEAFSAEELARVYVGENHIGHAEVRIGDSVVMLFDANPGWPDTPGFMRLFVADGDAVLERALRAGATLVTPMADHSFGDRVGRVRDPKGNVWWIQTHVRDVSLERMQSPTPAEQQAMHDAMTTLDRELSARAKK